MKRGGTSCALFVFVFVMVAALPIWSQKVINLTSDGADVYIHRDSTSEQFGFSAATGDFNKDGYMDIAIGSITATPPSGPSQAGKVYVFYGDGSWPADINLDTTSADLEIQGAGYGEWLGFAVEFADLNKDGYDDIIIGGPGWYGSGDPGNVYIIFGRVEPLFGVINARGDQSLRITSKKRLGFALACGDVNKNGYTDLVISAPGPEAPESFVFDGSTLTGITVPYTIDLSTQSADIKIINYSPAASTANGSGCSKELACGDVNGDGYADILLGAPIADPEGRSDAGKVHAIFGSSNPPGIIDLSIAFADVTIYGAYAGEMFGNALASGDLNNDGYNDIIVGEWPEDHAVHVFFGSSSIPTVIDLNSASADITVLGDGTPCMFGARLATGDINSDCYEDLVIGAPHHQGYAVYAIYGRSFSVPLVIDLKTANADLTVYAGTNDNIDWLGIGLACGDVNNDSIDDLIIGAEESDPAGKVFIIWGEGENYIFDGFFSPLENAPTVNNAKAGQTIPVKWRLTDESGVPISDSCSFKSITSYAVTCVTFSGDPSDPVEEYSSGSSGLQYLGDGYWQFNWKTPKSYAGKCRVMVLALGDSTTHTANFTFK